MANENGNKPGSLLRYLPGIYQQEEFLGRFLSAFEKILVGNDDGRDIPPLKESLSPGTRHRLRVKLKGLEETIAEIATLFIPFVAEDDKKTPHDSCTRDEFLPWLAQWAALSLRADLPEAKQREFIANAINSYSKRGTPENLIALLRIFSVADPTIEENATPTPQGDGGSEKRMPPGSTHYFRVKVYLGSADLETINHQRDIADSLIKLEKPAHTHYDLKVLFTTMRISDNPEKTTQIGKTTIIGVMPGEQ
jgi:P2-related tail formation protein